MQAPGEEPRSQSWPSQARSGPLRVVLSYGHRHRQAHGDSGSDSVSTDSATDDSEGGESERKRRRPAAQAPAIISPVVIALGFLLIVALALAVYFGVRNFRSTGVTSNSSTGVGEGSAASGGGGMPGTVTETVVSVSTVGSAGSALEDETASTQSSRSSSRPTSQGTTQPPTRTGTGQSGSSTGSPATPTKSGQASSGGSSAGSDDPFIQSCLDAHNGFRNKHHAESLIWNTTLQAAAQKWADHCVWEHSGGKVGPYGENLFAFAPIQEDQPLDPKDGIDGWNSEEKDYDYEKPTGFSHFTQTVWIGTKQVGCAFARCKGFLNSPLGAFLVCEYWPGGNIVTDDLKSFEDNVKPP